MTEPPTPPIAVNCGSIISRLLFRMSFTKSKSRPTQADSIDSSSNYTISLSTTPSGELVCRFVGHIIERLHTNILGKPAYSRVTLRNGLYALVRRLVFEYAEFKMTSHQGRRIDAVLATLVHDGKLTVGKWRKSQWLGFLTLRSLLLSYVSDGLVNGVRSWDVRVSRWLSVVFQSSADSRSGEIVKSASYDKFKGGDKFMRWKDVEIQLVGGSQFEHLQARATILWEKGGK